MHDIKWIRDEPEGLINALVRRGGGSEEAKSAAEALVTKLRGLDEQRRATLTQLETLLARRNAASKEIGQAKAKKDEATASALMAEVAELKEKVPALEAESKRLEAELNGELAAIPNAPLAEVPDGADEHANIERKDHRFGIQKTAANMGFSPKQHFEVGEALGQMDFETAAKLSGARFVVNKGPLARLERALGQFFLDTHTAPEQDGIGGYMEVNPPLLVRDEAMFGTAQLPKFEEDQYRVVQQLAKFEYSHLEIDSSGRIISNNIVSYSDYVKYIKQPNTSYVFPDAGAERRGRIVEEALWLIPTAEVPLTNLVRESILSEEELPLRLTACTPCFRAEAGAAGRDTRGMIRQHQFTKVELVSITTPEKSGEEHERMLACAEAVLKKLDLHYRVVTLCTGDMGFASQKTYDIEVWLPGQGAFREISSCSVCGDFQARRMNARYRPAEGKGPRFVHTLNGSGVAVGRALVAVLETYQQENGAVTVPDALLPYMGGLKTIEKLK
ncbi:serine--tRNA ligase [Xanthobacter oligotrophicus]|uniref:serine--tRNA ligase n=1 Tax=Xanthobacter oligotrophicus TaxID=2607286 RepID=UPI0011F2E07C|nr:serine--tRNA ligase [Xanthobacter oligotrophicus]MCG5233643.1 serine--tRNA ligase [Xanthobacter oligotrophicus]